MTISQDRYITIYDGGSRDYLEGGSLEVMVLKNTLLSRRREKLEVVFVVEGRRHPIGDASLIITYITIYIDNIYCI